MTAPVVNHLRSLLSRVESATGPDRELDAAIWCEVGSAPERTLDGCLSGAPLDPSYRIMGVTMHRMMENFPKDHVGAAIAWCAPKVSSSLDAAVALVERCLPGASFTINSFDVQSRPERVRAVRTHLSSYGHPDPTHCGSLGAGPTEPLALCAALLKALIARGERT